MKRYRISGAGRIALIYFLVSVAYVYLSDFLIRAVVDDPDLLGWILSNKRIFFLAGSSALIYYLVWKNERNRDEDCSRAGCQGEGEDLKARRRRWSWRGNPLICKRRCRD